MMKTVGYNDIKNNIDNEIRTKIEKVVETKDKYIDNIENELRALGEHELANELLHHLKVELSTSSIRISRYTKRRLNNAKKARRDGSIETYDNVVSRLLNL